MVKIKVSLGDLANMIPPRKKKLNPSPTNSNFKTLKSSI